MAGQRKNDPAISVLSYKLFLSTAGGKYPKPRQCHYLISNKEKMDSSPMPEQKGNFYTLQTPGPLKRRSCQREM